ncbi:MAG: hypothetical protein IH921_13510 [Gemmatimonadetes bacterium]|nr:hypothetical protein [Gemmatimonadota bacterium]
MKGSVIRRGKQSWRLKFDVGRDPATGAPTGLMIESASGLVESVIANSGYYTQEMDRAAMAQSISTLNSYGVTAFLDAAAMQPILAALKGLDDRGGDRVHVFDRGEHCLLVNGLPSLALANAILARTQMVHRVQASEHHRRHRLGEAVPPSHDAHR